MFLLTRLYCIWTGLKIKFSISLMATYRGLKTNKYAPYPTISKIQKYVTISPVIPTTPVTPVPPVTVFQAARDRVSEEIGSIVECLNNKRTELFEEIASLEREFSDKQKEKQKDITKLNTLISQTEELGQNTLLKLQQKLIQEIQQEIESLNAECKQEPDYRIEIKWEFKKQQFIKGITKSSIQTVKSSMFLPLPLPFSGFESSDNGIFRKAANCILVDNLKATDSASGSVCDIMLDIASD